MLKRLIMVLAFGVLVPASAFAQHKTAFRWATVAAVSAHGADLSTTAWCLAQTRCHEANPALRWAQDDPVKFGLVKMSVATAMQWFPFRLRRQHRKLAFWVQIAQAGAYYALALRNAKLVLHHTGAR